MFFKYGNNVKSRRKKYAVNPINIATAFADDIFLIGIFYSPFNLYGRGITHN